MFALWYINVMFSKLNWFSYMICFICSFFNLLCSKLDFLDTLSFLVFHISLTVLLVNWNFLFLLISWHGASVDGSPSNREPFVYIVTGSSALTVLHLPWLFLFTSALNFLFTVTNSSFIWKAVHSPIVPSHHISSFPKYSFLGPK